MLRNPKFPESSLMNYQGIKFTKEQYKNFCKVNFDNFQLVPKKIRERSSSICEIGVDMFADNIRHVPKKQLTVKLCERALKKDPLCGDCMPPELYLQAYANINKP